MIIDLIICAVILVSAIVAFFRGFIREVLTIIGVVGGLFAAYSFGESLAPFYNNLMGVDPSLPEEEVENFMGVLPYPTLSIILGYATIFFGVVIALSVISFLLSKFIENIGMGMLDRTLGVIFGIARGVVLLGVLYLPVHMFVEEENKTSWFESSRLHGYIEWTAEWMTGFLPEDFVNDGAQEKVDETRETLKALEILPEVNTIIQDAVNKDGPQSTPAEPAEAAPKEDVPAEGYKAPQRQSLEELIEGQTGLSDEKPVNENE